LSLLSESELAAYGTELPPPSAIKEVPLTSIAAPIPARTAPSTNAAGGRNFFTPEEDQVLRKYVQQKVREGGKISGNEIYKTLAEQVW
jgi:hypothetical protein